MYRPPPPLPASTKYVHPLRSGGPGAARGYDPVSTPVPRPPPHRRQDPAPQQQYDEHNYQPYPPSRGPRLPPQQREQPQPYPLTQGQYQPYPPSRAPPPPTPQEQYQPYPPSRQYQQPQQHQPPSGYQRYHQRRAAGEYAPPPQPTQYAPSQPTQYAPPQPTQYAPPQPTQYAPSRVRPREDEPADAQPVYQERKMPRVESHRDRLARINQSISSQRGTPMVSVTDDTQAGHLEQATARADMGERTPGRYIEYTPGEGGEDAERNLVHWKDVHGIKIEEIKELQMGITSRRFKVRNSDNVLERLSHTLQACVGERNMSTRDLAVFLYKGDIKYIWVKNAFNAADLTGCLFFGLEQDYLSAMASRLPPTGSREVPDISQVLNILPDNDWPVPPNKKLLVGAPSVK